MVNSKKTKKLSRIAYAVAIMLIFSWAFIQSTQIIEAQTQNSPWAMTLQIQQADQNSTTSAFSPFNQIQLSTNITYNNESQPNILVSFNVQGPIGSTSTTNITRIQATDIKGKASFVFRLPMQTQNSLIGTWTAAATIQTSNGALQKSLNFTTQWNLEITSLNLFNSQNQSQTNFSSGDTVTVQLLINNRNQPQIANISINMIDSAGKIINQTQTRNSQIDTSNATQLEAAIQIPTTANAGQATVNAAIFAGSYEDVNIPVAENQTAPFMIAGNEMGNPTPSPPTDTPSPTPNASPPPFFENSISLFSWLLVATGFFTFTMLFMFLKRKPMPKIGVQMPNLPSPTPSQGAMSPTQPASPATITPKIAPENTINATVLTQIPSIFETLEIASPQSTPVQEQKQSIVNYLAKISSSSERVQALEAELRTEKEQLNKEITGLTQTLEEQERAVKNYFDSIRQEIAKLNANINHTEPIVTHEKKTDQPSAEKTEENNN